MPTEKHTYKCEICEKEYTSHSNEEAKRLAEECEDAHEFVYLKLLRTDVQRLLAFIYSKEDELLTETLVKELQKYRTL